MPKRFELLVFDWDGTLMDSAAVIVESLQAACAELLLPVPGENEARYIIGLGLADAMRVILPGVDPARYPEVAECYRRQFLMRDAGTTLFPGIAEIIRELHAANHMLAIATGKGRRGLDRALDTTGLAGFFHATRCADEGYSKPHPGMLEQLMDTLRASPDRTLMIGDTTHDMEMAKNAGVERLGVAYGAHAKEALLAFEPVACADNVAGLRDWLSRHA